MTKRFVTQTRINKTVDGEYQVKAYDQYGSRLKAADYFTDDKEDAEISAGEMRRDGARKLAGSDEFQTAREFWNGLSMKEKELRAYWKHYTVGNGKRSYDDIDENTSFEAYVILSAH